MPTRKPKVTRVFSVRSITWPVTLVMLVCLLAMVGCQQPKAKGKALVDPLAPSVSPQIAPLDGLARIVAFSSPAYGKTGNGQMSVVVPIRLTKDQHENVGIEYKFEFFHKDGSPILPGQEWQFMNLPPGQQRYVKGQAQTTRTEQWRLVMRPYKE